jgi:ribosomal-protein-alanine N-acetyltransferase
VTWLRSVTAAVEHFETARLYAQRPRSEHLQDLGRIFSDPRAARTLGGVRTAEQVALTLARFQQQWERTGYGPWLFYTRVEGRFAGYCGLLATRAGGSEGVELLYALLPDFWGRGLASEMAAEVVRMAFEQIGVTELVSHTLPTNRASRRVMEKAGSTYERDIEHAGLPHVLYRLPAARWQAARRAG